MHLTLNGRSLEVASTRDRASVLDVLSAAGMDDARGVAVAIDGDVVPRSSWAVARVAEGQQVEVLRAVQGGSR